MTRYIFDVTALRAYLARHARLSGIQRVSVMCIARAGARLGAGHVWLGYHHRAFNTYRLVPCPADPAIDLTDPATFRALLRVRIRARALPGMKKYAGRPVGAGFAIAMRDLNAWLGRERYFTRRGISARQWRAARNPRRGAGFTTGRGKDLHRIARPGDRLILLDNAWHPRGLEDWLRRAGTEMRLEVWVLLHDLIPLVAPQFTEADVPARFHGWLGRATQYVTGFLANSENTARDLRGFLESRGASQPVTVVALAQSPVIPGVIPRGAEAPEAAYTAFHDGARMPDRLRALTKTSYVLVVGTREVRKNLWRVATIWDRLRHERGRDLPKLVIAGQRGWLNEDFDALMAATGRLGGWVEIVDSPSDRDLDYLYRNCLFTITASFYEGWGLPIGESLAYGKTAVVSNTSAMPEVGRDLVEYCAPHSLDDIEAACLRLLDDPDHRRALEARIAAADLRSWDDVAADILDAVID